MSVRGFFANYRFAAGSSDLEGTVQSNGFWPVSRVPMGMLVIHAAQAKNQLNNFNSSDYHGGPGDKPVMDAGITWACDSMH
jgi:hypothetical protein